jgi:hypothetical protein
LALATVAMVVLYQAILRRKVLVRERFRKMVPKIQAIKDFSLELQKAAERQKTEMSRRTMSGPRFF